MSKAEFQAVRPLRLDKTDFQGLGETTTNSGRAPLMAPDRQENDTQ
ncbi:aminoglycoside 6'-N-acetyltransferase [Rhizobium binae]|uniref:Aminoglycoside 6'-N-acetyltransferase n=1 Tax=Rhizobium binae TaxID=1138190 RepID=A0ABV2MFK6_9HYPH